MDTSLDIEPTPTPSDYASAEAITAQDGEMPFMPAGIPIGPTVAPSPTDGAKPLKNRKHERFCLLLCQGIRPTDAYIKTVSAHCTRSSASCGASMLQRRADVQARIKYLTPKAEFKTPAERAETLASVDLTRNNLLDKLREIIERSTQPTAIISAIERYATLASIGPEERATGQLTPEQAQRYARAALDNLQARLRTTGGVVLEIVTGTEAIRRECTTSEARALLDATICSGAERTPPESQGNNSAQSEQTPANIGETA